MGAQGAVFRYQITPYGTSLIPITHEIGYITSGIYKGETALSASLWGLGTFILVCITIFSLVCWNSISRPGLRFIVIGISSASILYLASCGAQYGPTFFGQAGVSLPCGIIILAIFAGFLHFYPDTFFENDPIRS